MKSLGVAQGESWLDSKIDYQNAANAFYLIGSSPKQFSAVTIMPYPIYDILFQNDDKSVPVFVKASGKEIRLNLQV